MNRNEERRDLSKKILVAMLSYDDGQHIADLPAFQKKVARVVVGYADALLDELDYPKEDTPETPAWVKPGSVSYPVATGEVQVGDLVMVRDTETESWVGPRLLTRFEPTGRWPYVVGTGARAGEGWRAGKGWRFARHLTNEERAQIKRI